MNIDHILDMLLSQLALDAPDQKPDRIRTLKAALQGKSRP